MQIYIGGLINMEAENETEKLVIIGGGPAGLTAAIYAGRSGLEPLVINGPEPGGRITTTSELENYPGFPEGIGGFEIMQKFTEQAERFAARMVYEIVEDVDFSEKPYMIETEENNYRAESIIIATGSNPRQLGVKGEEEFTGSGVSYCATCDGPFFKNKEVVVVGGGNVALEEANYLTNFASRVYLIHRRDKFRGTDILAQKVKDNSDIKILWDTEVKEIKGDNSVKSLLVEKNKTQDQQELPDVQGLFIAVGQKPNTDVISGIIDRDKKGYIITNDRQETNKEGIFAAGDCQDPRYKQVVISAGTATIAALETYKYLEGY